MDMLLGLGCFILLLYSTLSLVLLTSRYIGFLHCSYFRVNRLLSVILSEALPTRASNSPFSDFHEPSVSS